MKGFLGKIIGGKGAEIIESVGNVADKFITTPHEKEQFSAEVQKEINRHVEAMEVEANREMEIYNKNTADARLMNANIQDSDKASWMSKNIAYILDLVIVASFLTMLGAVFTIVIPESNKEIFYTGFGLLGGYVGATMNFHRGTSIGSERKQRQLEKIQKKQSELH